MVNNQKKALPINWSESIEVMHHNVMDVLQAVHFPEGVEVADAALPQARDFTEGLNCGAAL